MQQRALLFSLPSIFENFIYLLSVTEFGQRYFSLLIGADFDKDAIFIRPATYVGYYDDFGKSQFIYN